MRLLYRGFLMVVRGLLLSGLLLVGTAHAVDTAVRPESFVGTYRVIGQPVDSDLVQGVSEITIRVDKTTNTLYMNATLTKDTDDEGKPFLPALEQIDLEPKVTQTKTADGCLIHDQLSKSETSRIVTTIDDTAKLGCWLRVSNHHTEITIQFGNQPDEIWIGVGKRMDIPKTKYSFHRFPEVRP